jgi:hypothetical protein
MTHNIKIKDIPKRVLLSAQAHVTKELPDTTHDLTQRWCQQYNIDIVADNDGYWATLKFKTQWHFEFWMMMHQ